MLRVTLIALVLGLVAANPAILPNIFRQIKTIFSHQRSNPGYIPAFSFPDSRYGLVAAPAYGTYRPAPYYSYTPASYAGYTPTYGYAPAYSYDPQYGYGYTGSNLLGFGTPNIGQYLPGAGYKPSGVPKPDIIKEEAQESGHGHGFGYGKDDGPSQWYKEYPSCGGNAQSPIDINLQVVESATYPAIKRTNYWAQPKSLVVENNGHTLEISGEWPIGKTPTISGGPLKHTYQIKQLHFHWGLDNDSGSEHTVDDNQFPMELHAVHWNMKYKSYDEAVKHKDGLAVFGYLYEISKTDNEMMDLVIKYMEHVEGSDTKEVHVKEPFPIAILGLDRNTYATYSGSLTTPPCSEIVTWMVAVEPLNISNDQIERMRNVVKDASHEEAIHNYREPQALNGRKVYINA